MEKTVANKNIFDKDFILLDGAMGTMLQQKGMELGTVPETLNITKPDWIIDIHKQYIDAGSDVVYANTFGANRYKMANTGYSVDELIGAAINNAKEAAKAYLTGYTSDFAGATMQRREDMADEFWKMFARGF